MDEIEQLLADLDKNKATNPGGPYKPPKFKTEQAPAALKPGGGGGNPMAMLQGLLGGGGGAAAGAEGAGAAAGGAGAAGGIADLLPLLALL